MGTLKSREFAGDARLEACAVSDPAHVMPGSVGDHVGKIQQALIKVGGLAIDPTELAQKRYGQSTVEAVRRFKTERSILNYAGQIDVIVGKKTIRALDDGLLAPAPIPPLPPGPPSAARDLSFGMTGRDVENLQLLLNHHLSGLPLKPLNPDGIFGNETRNRVMEFQKRNRLLPTRMQVPDEFSRPLKVDGIVGQHTLRVLLDIRKLYSTTPSSFSPVDEDRASGGIRAASRFGVQPVGDDPQPQPIPPRTFHMFQLQSGTQLNLNPWAAAPFLFTAQYVLLAKNQGKPDFLLTAGVQIGLNDDRPPDGQPEGSGRWTGQGFLQYGFANDITAKVFGQKFDLVNPFVQAMISQNLSRSGQFTGPINIGLAVGNQASWVLIERNLPGTTDKQDVLSIFFNGQVVTNVALQKGHVASPPDAQLMIGATVTLF